MYKKKLNCKINSDKYHSIDGQRSEVNGTVVAGNHEFPAMRFLTVKREATPGLVIT